MSLHPDNAYCPKCFNVIHWRPAAPKLDWHCKCDEPGEDISIRKGHRQWM